MLYTKYLIRCVFEEDGTLNTFKGSALRGAFGHALKKAVCTVHNKECMHCILQKQCLFAKLFTEGAKQNTQDKAPSALFPYMIEPPQDKKVYYKKGDNFEVGLILLDSLWRSLPFFIFAFELMGEKGIGKSSKQSDEGKFKKQKISFTIEDVVACHQEQEFSIYDAKNKQLYESPPPKVLSCKKVEGNLAFKQKLEINLLTPLRFKQNNHLSKDLDFAQFYTLMARRITTLFNTYPCSDESDSTALDFDYHELLAKAKEIQTVESNISWEDHIRYSAKQQSKLKLGGLQGSIIYEGDFLPFLPLLELATLLHLGKQSTFGLGRIQYTLKA